MNGSMRTVYFDLSVVDALSNEVEFFLILGMMFTVNERHAGH